MITKGALAGRFSLPVISMCSAMRRMHLTHHHQKLRATMPTSPLSRLTERNRSASERPRSCAGLYRQSSTVRDNLRRLIQSNSLNVTDKVKHRGRSEKQAIEPIQETTMAGECGCPVLNSQIPFDR